MKHPLSSFGGSTFRGTIKVKTLTETHSEKKFGASLATWHCPPTLKSPCTKISIYEYSLSSFGGSTFKGTIKVKALTETHSEQKFGASLATWHCPPTLKSPRTKISTYDKSLVKFGSRYFQGDNQSENNDLNPFRAKVWSIFGHMALPTNTQKSPYQNIHL